MSTPSASPASPQTMYGVQCLRVPSATARRIAAGEKQGVGMVPGMAVAVKSPDLANVYFVAMQFQVSGVAETQLGFWALHPSVNANQHGRIMAVGTSAQHFTRWPHVRYPSADIRRKVKATVGGSSACLLK